MKQHLLLMESRVKVKLSYGLGSIGTGQGNKEKQIVLDRKELPKTLHRLGLGKGECARTANKPKKHLARETLDVNIHNA
jgi:hypothetical protein